MFREIKKQFYLRWDEIVMILVLEAGLFLFGELILVFAVRGMGETDSVFPLGTLMALMVPVFIMVFLGMGSLPLYFNTVIGMGMTRRRLVPLMFAFSFLQNMAGIWIAYLFYYLETWIFRTAYAGIRNELDLQFVFQWKYIVPICMVIVALNVMMGAMWLKYGKKALTIFWILWMAVFIGGPRIGRMLAHGKGGVFFDMCRKIVDLFSHCSEAGIIMMVIAVSVGLMVVACGILCKQQVEY